jgi:CBS domain-containing membrane protein
MPRRRTKIQRWIQDLLPPPIEVALHERWRVALATGLSLVLIALFWRLLAWALQWQGERLGLLAPLGASALLVFAVPASPMAQPWPVVVGNTLSVVVGMTAVHLLPVTEAALALALPASIVLMYVTRSLHPPGAAMALLMVLTGSQAQPWPLLICGLVGSLWLVVLGRYFNAWSGKLYPVRLPVHG